MIWFQHMVMILDQFVEDDDDKLMMMVVIYTTGFAKPRQSSDSGTADTIIINTELFLSSDKLTWRGGQP